MQENIETDILINPEMTKNSPEKTPIKMTKRSDTKDKDEKN